MTAIALQPPVGPDDRRRALQTSARLLARHDLRDLTLADFAADAGVSLGALRAMFEDPHDILGAVMDETTDTLFWHPAPSPRLRPEIQLALLARRHLRMFHEHRALALAVLRNYEHLQDPYRRSFRNRTAVYREQWLVPLRRLAPTLPAARLDPVVMAILDALHARGQWVLTPRDVVPAAEAFTAFLLRTVRRYPYDIAKVFHTVLDANAEELT